ncbi:glycoside hydrolase family 3 C-terminal domain-containing protein [Acetanaerobacterium elongatum]|uniref:Beta-glucosidase n=1 Tax=Acetanaerobacterium elongatum TaxID=258515 RepID=A0A1H0CVK6_9FIRM|nr:glycoside hydrolase family 3 N-terminal domain-containing protein [Acetanaerobacterium elongatum]SDN61904.1 beta-glucosidase [Acetanaerobacterium elongatum]
MKNDFRARAEELVSQMTLEEAASQLRYDAPAISRLGIPSYNWWNEALHGMARAGTATIFPQAIGLAAMFDPEFLTEIAEVISTEARAKYNMNSKNEDRDIYKGLTVWSPNVNIFRDPRWGRGQETYGEDPYLTKTLGVAFIRGLQGNGKYLKTAACAKHFAVHSGPEANRHSFDAKASLKDMEETYLPAFEAAVKEAEVEAVMGAYNRVNGEPSCGSKTLLVDILRERWGFKGHVVSDCWAIRDFHEHHRVTDTPAQSAALALQNGCDLNCGNTYLHMLEAYQEGLVTEEQIRKAAVRLFETRMRLGLFDSDCEYDNIPYDENDSDAHRALSLEAARRSAVLLKNNGILPLNRNKITRLAVIGPTANSRVVLEGNYCGTASEYVTNLEGIKKAAGSDIRVFYSMGCHLFKDRVEPLAMYDDRLSEAKGCAAESDAVILCLGLDATIEGEQGDTGNSYAAGDKPDLLLLEPQRKLLEAVLSVGKPVVLVINSGSALDIGSAAERCAAVMQCWYSGAQGGNALAEILFGQTNPSGRLPVTFCYDGTMPDYEDYSMHNRTYRYMQDKPLYPFGYGLSYTTFRYADLKLDANKTAPEKNLCGEITVTNEGSRDGAETVQIYIKNHVQENAAKACNAEVKDLLGEQPNFSLCGMKHIFLKAGESAKVRFEIKAASLTTVLLDGRRVYLPGHYSIYVGGSQPDERSFELAGKRPLSTDVYLG